MFVKQMVIIIQKFKSLNRTSHNKSKVTIFKTIKGKGVSFMENKTLWHYKSPTYHEYTLALKEIM